jgi:hypothetical protein
MSGEAGSVTAMCVAAIAGWQRPATPTAHEPVRPAESGPRSRSAAAARPRIGRLRPRSAPDRYWAALGPVPDDWVGHPDNGHRDQVAGASTSIPERRQRVVSDLSLTRLFHKLCERSGKLASAIRPHGTRPSYSAPGTHWRKAAAAAKATPGWAASSGRSRPAARTPQPRAG